jgi:hypothetical protein
VNKNDENEEGLNKSVLIHGNCKLETTTLNKNLESNLGQRMHRDGISRFLTDLECKSPVGNTVYNFASVKAKNSF